MIQPATNAQVALQCATQIAVLMSEHELVGHLELANYADGLLRWLDANTPPAPDQPGGLG